MRVNSQALKPSEVTAFRPAVEISTPRSLLLFAPAGMVMCACVHAHMRLVFIFSDSSNAIWNLEIQQNHLTILGTVHRAFKGKEQTQTRVHLPLQSQRQLQRSRCPRPASKSVHHAYHAVQLCIRVCIHTRRKQ